MVLASNMFLKPKTLPPLPNKTIQARKHDTHRFGSYSICMACMTFLAHNDSYTLGTSFFLLNPHLLGVSPMFTHRITG